MLGSNPSATRLRSEKPKQRSIRERCFLPTSHFAPMRKTQESRKNSTSQGSKNDIPTQLLRIQFPLNQDTSSSTPEYSPDSSSS